MNPVRRPRSAFAALALLAAAVICSLDLPPALAQSDKPDPLLALLEADFLALWPKVAQFQDDYQRLHGGRFYQALDSHSAPPTDGQLAPADKLQSGPTDQGEKLDILWLVAALPPELPYSFRIDVYDGPSGRGYVVTLTADVGGRLWQRAINSGPETYREQGWLEAKPASEVSR